MTRREYVLEIEADESGWHFIVFGADDYVVRVGLSHETRDDAERDATEYVYRLLSQLLTA